MERREVAVFSEDGSRLAVCCLDGEVKIWSSATGTLVSRFSPDLGQDETVTAACWSRAIPKHRKSGQKLAVSVGSKVVLWNEAKGRQERVLDEVHSDSVSGVCWGRGNNVLFSSSHDKHVAVWNTKTWDCQHKWKADKHGISCISCHRDREILATAGRTIKLWSSEDFSLLKKFSGHATSVTSLSFIEDTLLLSSATADRVLSLWSSEVKSSSAIASFSCEQEVASCFVSVAMGTVHAVALTVEGILHMFKYPLTNQIAAPITAHSTVQFTTVSSSKGETPSPLPVMAVSLQDEEITIAHGSTIRPSIESLRWSDCEGERLCLVRERMRGLLLPGTGDSARDVNHKTPQHTVTVLGPGHMTTTRDHMTTTPLSTDLTETVLGGRMRREGVASATEEGGSSRVASTETVSRLLGQAVRSGDRTLLEEALRVRKENVIKQTIKRLPVSLILPLLKQLVSLVESSPGRGLELSLWVHHLLTQHSSYLITQPQLMTVLSSFYQLLETRSSVYDKLCKIHGKLGLMNIHEAESPVGVASEPLLSMTLGDEVGYITDSSCEGEAEDEELESDQSDAESYIAMDTEHKHEDLT